MVQLRQRGSAMWFTSRGVCAYADRDRHLGHIVRAGEGWIAFDATHVNTQGNAFRPLGFFRSMATAKEAVQTATDRQSKPLMDALGGTRGLDTHALPQ